VVILLRFVCVLWLAKEARDQVAVCGVEWRLLEMGRSEERVRGVSGMWWWPCHQSCHEYALREVGR
jgi:hypothetical protein